MNITVVCVGKLKEKYWVDACNEYLKRLKPYAQVTVKEIPDVDPAKAGGIAGSLEREGAAIVAALPERAHVLLLAIKGKQRTSEEFSARLDDLALQGKSDLAFVIGGSDGVNDAVRAHANETLSFGAITLPHNLARVVLLEQIYRAFKISRGEPDLCQDFGHGSSRIYAATGSSSAAGFVRSKKASMAFAGIW